MIMKNERKKYASDITDSQWEIIKPMLPKAGHKSKWEKRELINAALYFLENGCKWRSLRHDFPPSITVSNFYYAAVKSGLCEKLLAVLVRYTREKAGLKTEPSYGIIDSQSVKTAGRAENKEIDWEKNERSKTAYSSRYNGKSFISCCSRSKYPRHEIRHFCSNKSDTKISIYPTFLC